MAHFFEIGEDFEEEENGIKSGYFREFVVGDPSVKQSLGTTQLYHGNINFLGVSQHSLQLNPTQS